MESRQRDSRFELLRIVAIFIITIHHAVYHSDIMAQTMTLNRLTAHFFMFGGKLGVNLFLLISGYFSCTKTTGFARRTVKTILTVWTYCIVILGVTAICAPHTVTAKQLLKSLFPTTMGMYWFMTAFVGLQLVSPWLNKLILRMNRQEHANMLIMLVGMFSLLPTFLTTGVWGNHFVWFAVVYLTAAYLRQYGAQLGKIHLERRSAGVTAAVSLGVMWLCNVSFYWIGTHTPFHQFLRVTNYFAMHMENVFMLAASVAIFWWFKEMPSFESHAVNVAAANVLGAYLLQSNTLTSSRLWRLVHTYVNRDGALYPAQILGFGALIVVAGVAVNVVMSKGVNLLSRTKPVEFLTRKLALVTDK